MTPRVAPIAISLTIALAFLPLAAGPARAEVAVSVEDVAFVPQHIVVPIGETVTWTWSSGFHTSTSGLDTNDPNAGALWDSPWIFDAQPSFSYTFAAPGFYPYFCRIHGSIMTGTVRVGRAAPTASRFKGATGSEPTSWGMIKAIYR